MKLKLFSLILVMSVVASAHGRFSDLAAKYGPAIAQNRQDAPAAAKALLAEFDRLKGNEKVLAEQSIAIYTGKSVNGLRAIAAVTVTVAQAAPSRTHSPVVSPRGRTVQRTTTPRSRSNSPSRVTLRGRVGHKQCNRKPATDVAAQIAADNKLAQQIDAQERADIRSEQIKADRTVAQRLAEKTNQQEAYNRAVERHAALKKQAQQNRSAQERVIAQQREALAQKEAAVKRLAESKAARDQAEIKKKEESRLLAEQARKAAQDKQAAQEKAAREYQAAKEQAQANAGERRRLARRTSEEIKADEAKAEAIRKKNAEIASVEAETQAILRKQRAAEEKAAQDKRIADEKAAQERRIAAEKAEQEALAKQMEQQRAYLKETAQKAAAQEKAAREAAVKAAEAEHKKQAEQAEAKAAEVKKQQEAELKKQQADAARKLADEAKAAEAKKKADAQKLIEAGVKERRAAEEKMARDSAEADDQDELMKDSSVFLKGLRDQKKATQAKKAQELLATQQAQDRATL